MTSVIKVDTIQNSSGTSALSIDSSGRVTNNNPMFYVAKNSGGGAAAASGHITFNNVVQNVGNGWDSNNNYFNAPVTGNYLFNIVAFECTSSSGALGDTSARACIELSVDSGSNWTSLACGHAYDSVSSHANIGTSVVYRLNAGDLVRMNVQENYAYFDTENKYLNFSGALIG